MSWESNTTVRYGVLAAAATVAANDEESRVFLRGVYLRHWYDTEGIQIVGCDGHMAFDSREATWNRESLRLPDEGFVVPRREVFKLFPKGAHPNTMVEVVYHHDEEKFDLIPADENRPLCGRNPVRGNYPDINRILSQNAAPTEDYLYIDNRLLVKAAGAFAQWDPRTDEEKEKEKTLPVRVEANENQDAAWMTSERNDVYARCLIMGVRRDD